MTQAGVKKTTQEIIRRAGGAAYLSEAMRIPHRVTGKARKVTPQAIGQWAPIPAEAVIELIRCSKEPLTLHEVRPDLYPNPAWRVPRQLKKAGRV